jgi:hypothetical protein
MSKLEKDLPNFGIQMSWKAMATEHFYDAFIGRGKVTADDVDTLLLKHEDYGYIHSNVEIESYIKKAYMEYAKKAGLNATATDLKRILNESKGV